MRIRRGCDSLLNRISSGICENATEIHRFELQRLGRRAAAESQFEEMVTDVKDRLARKASLITQLAFAVGSVEFPNKAA
ncbi:MAG TPA: hypothetical protein VKU19_17535 [Bryobacteraceae bacterium]|nr:hypothetical protein [Bryobacteraceae bacterium]